MNDSGFQRGIWSSRQRGLGWAGLTDTLPYPAEGMSPLLTWPSTFVDSSWFVIRVFLEVVQTCWPKSKLLFVFSALLCSPNGPLNIFINLLHTFFVFVYIISFDGLLFGRLPAVAFNKFVYLIDSSGKNNKKTGFILGQDLPPGSSSNMILGTSSYALESPDSIGPRLSHSPSLIAFGVPVFQAKANEPSRPLPK